MVPLLLGLVKMAGVYGLEGGLERLPHREHPAVVDERVVEQVRELNGSLI